MPKLPWYLIDLLCKSIEWFLYDGNVGVKWVNTIAHLLKFWDIWNSILIGKYKPAFSKSVTPNFELLYYDIEYIFSHINTVFNTIFYI